MKVSDIVKSGMFEVVCEGDGTLDVEGVFCCDLLSVAMGKGQAGLAWVTVMGNINTMAVLHLTDMSCLILAEGTSLDADAENKALQLNVTVMQSREPIFETALKIHEMMHQPAYAGDSEK